MAGIDDFRDLSNAVAEGGDKMRVALTHAVDAAREMDKALRTITKMADGATEVRTAVRSANDEFERMGRTSSVIKRLGTNLKKTAADGKSLKDSLADMDVTGSVTLEVDDSAVQKAKRSIEDLKDAASLISVKVAVNDASLGKLGKKVSAFHDSLADALQAEIRIDDSAMVRLQAQLEAMKSGLGVQVEAQVDDKALVRLQAQLEEMRAGLAIQVGAQVDDKVLGKLQAQLEEMRAGLAIPVGAQVDDKALGKLQAQLEEMRAGLAVQVGAQVDDSALVRFQSQLESMKSDLDVSFGGGGAGKAKGGLVFTQDDAAIKHLAVVADSAKRIADVSEKMFKHLETYDKRRLTVGQKQMLTVEKKSAKDDKTLARASVVEARAAQEAVEREQVPSIVVEGDKSPVASREMAGVAAKLEEANQHLERMERIEAAIGKDINLLTTEATKKGSLFVADAANTKYSKEISDAQKKANQLSRRPVRSATGARASVQARAQVKYLEELTNIVESLPQAMRDAIESRMAGGASFAEATEAEATSKRRRGSFSRKGLASAATRATEEAEKEFVPQGAVEEWKKEIGEVGSQLRTLKSQLRKASVFERGPIKAQIVELEKLKAQYEAFGRVAMDLSYVDRVILNAAAATGKLAEAWERVTAKPEYAHLRDEIEGIAEAAEEAASSESTMRKSMSAGPINKVTDSLAEGAEDAKKFAGGMKFSGLTMTGAALAAAYLVKQMGELIGKFKDAAINLSSYNVATAAMAKKMPDVGSTGQGLKMVRDELNLTREQASEFFDVLYEGVSSGVVTTQQLVEAGARLREAFGGDQTKRLKSYVDLLKEIPTLDTDLSFTATADDKAATLFALASKGKLGTVLELRAAGVAGGRARGAVSKKDVELLNNAQNTEKAVQDIKDGMLKRFFPTWGPQFSAIAENTAKILAAILAGFGVLGGINYLTGGTLSKVITPLLSGLAGTAPAAAPAGTSALSALMAKLGLNVRSAGTSLLNFAKTTTAITGVIGLAFGVAGIGADVLAKKFEESGDKTAASASRLSAGFLKFGGMVFGMMATGATIGSMGGPIGAAGGAIIGAIIGAAQQFEVIGKELKNLGNTFQDTEKYSKIMALWGKVMLVQASVYENTGKAINWVLKGVGTGLESLWNGLKTGASNWRDLAVAAKDWLVYSDKENKRREANAIEMEELADSMRMIGEVNDVLAQKMNKRAEDTDKSAYALSKIFGEVEAAVKNAKQELYEFRKSLAGVQLGNLAEIGGTADQFNQVMSSMTSSVRDRFDMQMKAYDKARQKIMTNGDLDAAARRMSLDKIHKAEADSTKEFVEGMKAAIEALYKAPQLIAAGLQAKLAKAKFDLKLEGKVFNLEELGEKFGESIDTASKNVERTMEAGSAAVGVAAKAQLGLAQKTRNQQAEAAKTLSGELAKAGGVVVEKVAAVEFDTAKMDDIPSEFAKKLIEAQVGGAGEGKTAIRADVLKELPADVQAALGAVTQIVGTNVKANAEALRKRFQENEAAMETLGAEMDTLNAGLPTDDLAGISAGLVRVTKRQKQYQDAIDEARKAMAKMDDKGVDISSDKYKKEQAKLEENLKAQREVNAQRDQMNQELDKYKASLIEGKKAEDIPLIKAAVDAVVASMNQGPKELTAAMEALHKVPALQGNAILETMDKFTRQMGQVAALSRTTSEKAKENEVIAAVTADTTANINLLSEAELKSLEANIQAQREVMDAIRKMTQLVSAELDDRRRELEVIKNNAEYAGLTGGATKNYTDMVEKQGEVWAEHARVLETLTGKANGEIAKWQAQIQDLEKTAKGEGKDAEDAKAKIAYLNAQIKEMRNGLKDQQKAVIDAAMVMVNTAMSFQGAMEQLSKTVEFREFSAKIDMSGAEMDLAQFSDNWRAVNQSGFEMAIEYGKKRFEAEKKMMLNSMAKQTAAINDFYNEAIPKGEATEQQRLAALETLQANLQLTLAQKEAEQKKLVVDRAKQSAQYATEMVDLQQQVVDAESQFLTEVGGNWNDILSLQAESVSLEKQKAEIAAKLAEDMEASGIRGRELAQAQTAAKLAELKYQQKALGAQKSVYEGLAGMAFGAIRASFGMRKNVDSAVMKMGRADTRIKTRAGLYRGANAGERLGTIEQRSIMNQLDSLGNSKGALAAEETYKDMMEKASGKAAPDKAVDAALFAAKEAEKTSKNTETGATAAVEGTSALKSLNKNATQAKSLYVADVVAQSLLSKMLGALTAIVQNTGTMMQGVSTTTGSTAAGAVTTKEMESVTQSLSSTTTGPIAAGEVVIEQTGGFESEAVAWYQTMASLLDISLSRLKSVDVSVNDARKEIVFALASWQMGKEISAPKASTVAPISWKESAEQTEQVFDYFNSASKDRGFRKQVKTQIREAKATRDAVSEGAVKTETAQGAATEAAGEVVKDAEKNAQTTVDATAAVKAAVKKAGDDQAKASQATAQSTDEVADNVKLSMFEQFNVAMKALKVANAELVALQESGASTEDLLKAAEKVRTSIGDVEGIQKKVLDAEKYNPMAGANEAVAKIPGILSDKVLPEVLEAAKNANKVYQGTKRTAENTESTAEASKATRDETRGMSEDVRSTFETESAKTREAFKVSKKLEPTKPLARTDRKVDRAKAVEAKRQKLTDMAAREKRRRVAPKTMAEIEEQYGSKESKEKRRKHEEWVKKGKRDAELDRAMSGIVQTETPVDIASAESMAGTGDEDIQRKLSEKTTLGFDAALAVFDEATQNRVERENEEKKRIQEEELKAARALSEQRQRDEEADAMMDIINAPPPPPQPKMNEPIPEEEQLGMLNRDFLPAPKKGSKTGAFTPEERQRLAAEKEQAAMAKDATTTGSIYTHDVSVENAIAGLGRSLETIFTRNAGGPETAPGMTETGGFAGMGDVGGVAGGGVMKVTGEITVRFDNNMFRTQVAQIVGEVIRQGDRQQGKNFRPKVSQIVSEVVRGGEIRGKMTQQGYSNQVV